MSDPKVTPNEEGQEPQPPEGQEPQEEGSEQEVETTTEVTEEDMSTMLDMLDQKPAAPAEPKPSEEEPKPGEPKPGEQPPAKPVEPKKETELEVALRGQAELRALLNEMAAKQGVPAPVQPAAPGTPTTPAPAVGSSPAAAVPDSPAPAGALGDQYTALSKFLSPETLTKFAEKLKEEIPFMSKEEIDTVIDKPELLIKSLNSVRRRTVEDMMGVLPMLIAEQVTSVIATQRVITEFYEANSDLNPFRNFTQSTYERVYAANSDKPMNEILKLTADTVRKDLRLATPVPKETKPAKEPKFPADKSGGARKPAPANGDKKKTQQDLMNETL